MYRFKVLVVTGSINATSGTSFLLIIAILTFLTLSDIIANWDTSAELPAVVGIHIRGGDGILTLSTPSNSFICFLFEVTIPIPFAQSIGLPPPRATITSHLLLS